jgi:sporulation protein YlmC with PRC-barrel domain
MLISRVRPGELWGKSVYDTDGRFVGQVVAIASRRGVLHKVVVRRTAHAPVRPLSPADVHVDKQTLVISNPLSSTSPRLRVVR